MSGTAMHAAAAALTAGFTSLNIPGLGVSDGPNWDPPVLCLEVGWSPTDPEPISVNRVLNDAGAGSHRESLAIDCLLSCHDGDKTVAQARAVIADVFAQLDGWICSTPSLNDSIALGHVASIGYLPLREEGGATASLRFTVACIAFV